MKSVVGIVLSSLVTLTAQTYDKYIWESHRTVGITGIDGYVTVLQAEIDKIIAAGHLRPLRAYHTDLKGCGYFVYSEPGRIITTLAMAYSYLTVAQRGRIKAYIRSESASAEYAPWSSNAHLPTTSGAFRNYSSMEELRGWEYYWGMDGQKRPRLHTLYGVWMYAYNSGDSGIVHDNWNAIKSFYGAHAGEGIIYGELCGHIAMARMAHMMHDDAAMNTAVSNAVSRFKEGLDFGGDSARTEALYDLVGYKYNGGYGRGTIHDGFMFVNMTPEVGRYLAESIVKTDVLRKNREGASKFPFWWLYKAPYFTTWGCEEGIGLVPEIIGMIFPLERWVAAASKETLRGYQMHRAMYGIGDCHALEAIVNTINAFGVESWADVRTTGPVNLACSGANGIADIMEKATVKPSGNGVLITAYAPGMRRLMCQLFSVSGKAVFSGGFDRAESGVFVKRVSLAPGCYAWKITGESGGKKLEMEGRCMSKN